MPDYKPFTITFEVGGEYKTITISVETQRMVAIVREVLSGNFREVERIIDDEARPEKERRFAAEQLTSAFESCVHGARTSLDIFRLWESGGRTQFEDGMILQDLFDLLLHEKAPEGLKMEAAGMIPDVLDATISAAGELQDLAARLDSIAEAKPEIREIASASLKRIAEARGISEKDLEGMREGHRGFVKARNPPRGTGPQKRKR